MWRRVSFIFVRKIDSSAQSKKESWQGYMNDEWCQHELHLLTTCRIPYMECWCAKFARQRYLMY